MSREIHKHLQLLFCWGEKVWPICTSQLIGMVCVVWHWHTLHDGSSLPYFVWEPRQLPPPRVSLSYIQGLGLCIISVRRQQLEEGIYTYEGDLGLQFQICHLFCVCFGASQSSLWASVSSTKKGMLLDLLIWISVRSKNKNVHEKSG